ncbi:MAG: transposase [Lentimicrobium sp.]
MFKKSDIDRQLDAFSNIPGFLDGTANKIFDDPTYWHNQFRNQVVIPIDETIYSVLFSKTMGAPNSSLRILIGMMILKESFGWSDSQLFEQCQFNLLVRSSLGLFNITDALPVQSTYYLLRKRIHEYELQTGENLIEKSFVSITQGQVKEFEVNGRKIRMDSKLVGSNIALFSRYEIIHHALCMFIKLLDKTLWAELPSELQAQMNELLQEEPQKTLYRSTKDEIKGRLQPIGILTYKMLQLFSGQQTDTFQLLERVFNEQYKVSSEQQVELRPKEEISSSSVQSPHDPDSAFRNKGDQKVKGYSVNITETCSDTGLNLITSTIVKKANVPDTVFVEQAIETTREVTGQKVDKVFTDGAYQSPDNDTFCEGIDMVYTGIQGAESRYDLELTPQGLLVTDTQTGDQQIAPLGKKQKNSKEDRYRIKSDKGYYYFTQQAIRASQMRRKMKERPVEETRKRNNVEATIFQFGLYLNNQKSKYRGLIKQKIWSFCRCFWINLVRIMNYLRKRDNKIESKSKNQEFSTVFQLLSTLVRLITQAEIVVADKFPMGFDHLTMNRKYRFT